MGIRPFGLFVGTTGNEGLSQITGAKDYVSLELPACHLGCYMETVPKNEAKNKQNQETVGDTERGKEAETEKLNPDNILGLEPNLPKGISCNFHVHQSISPLFSLTSVI